eukprot:PhM_4_TR8612/c0_g1_i1/m.78078
MHQPQQRSRSSLHFEDLLEAHHAQHRHSLRKQRLDSRNGSVYSSSASLLCRSSSNSTSRRCRNNGEKLPSSAPHSLPCVLEQALLKRSPKDGKACIATMNAWVQEYRPEDYAAMPTDGRPAWRRNTKVPPTNTTSPLRLPTYPYYYFCEHCEDARGELVCHGCGDKILCGACLRETHLTSQHHRHKTSSLKTVGTTPQQQQQQRREQDVEEEQEQEYDDNAFGEWTVSRQTSGTRGGVGWVLVETPTSNNNNNNNKNKASSTCCVVGSPVLDWIEQSRRRRHYDRVLKRSLLLFDHSNNGSYNDDDDVAIKYLTGQAQRPWR